MNEKTLKVLMAMIANMRTFRRAARYGELAEFQLPSLEMAGVFASEMMNTPRWNHISKLLGRDKWEVFLCCEKEMYIELYKNGELFSVVEDTRVSQTIY